jgi:hypothetical protein
MNSIERTRRLVIETTQAWLRDPASDVVWAGEYDGRWGIRMAQQVRDFTTVWFTIGERTVGIEAYLLPAPPHGHADVYRLCLHRNWRSWPASVALDERGDIFVVGRIPVDEVSAASLDRAVGAVYETVELSFRPLLRLGFQSSARS